MAYIFGPVPSRRLGLSLGVDLIPAKTCTFDCLYCQVGRTTSSILEPKSFVSVGDIALEIENKLKKYSPDAITLAGSGEPTLNSQIDQVIASIKGMTRTRVVLLTNGALFWRDDVRQRVLQADIIMPTLSSAFDDTFRRIHRPHPGLELSNVIDGLNALRQDYHGQLFLEVIFLAGINDTEKEIQGLKKVIEQINPDRIQLNTVVRPPADSSANGLDRKRLEEIKIFFGERTEIIAEVPLEGKKGKAETLVKDFFDMLKRRPLRPVDIANALSLSTVEVEDLVKGMLIKGYIRRQEHAGDVYYLKNEKNVQE